MACFAPAMQVNAAAHPVGMVTALYRGRAHGSVFRGCLRISKRWESPRISCPASGLAK